MANKAAFYFSPKSLEDLKQVVQVARKRNKCISITAKKKVDEKEKLSSHFVINMENFNKVIEINLTDKYVVVEASAEIGLIKYYLEKVGFALCMPGVSDDKTVASAFSSGCHSSIMSQGIITSYVSSIDVLTSDNKVVTLTPEDKQFRTIACGLGACGIILLLTLKCEPVYQLKTIQFGCSFDKLVANLPFNLKRFSNLSISWFPHTNNAIVANTEKIYDTKQTKSKLFSNVKHKTFDIVEICSLKLLYWFCLVFPFFIPTVHFLSFWFLFIWQQVHYFSPNEKILLERNSNHTSKTSEWFIPMRKTVTALKLIQKWCDSSSHYLHYPIHIQFIKKDYVYLSPANELDVCCISVRIHQPFGFYFPYEKAFMEFSEIMRNMGGRPKLDQNFNANNEDLDALFPNYEEWYAVRNELDPHNLFVNNLE